MLPLEFIAGLASFLPRPSAGKTRLPIQMADRPHDIPIDTLYRL
jgi:hypothetical protein